MIITEPAEGWDDQLWARSRSSRRQLELALVDLGRLMAQVHASFLAVGQAMAPVLKSWGEILTQQRERDAARSRAAFRHGGPRELGS